jgi:hypothetical protein
MAEAAVEGRGGWLPLGAELSARERAIEAEKALKLTAVALGLDFADIEVPRGVPPPASAALTTLAERLTDAKTPSEDWEESEKKVSRLLAVWDRKIQDTLAGQAAESNAAYQLARGLGEAYWTVDVGSPTTALQTVLGRPRVSALQQLLIPLSGHLPHLTILALHHALDEWSSCVTGLQASDEAVIAALVQQHRVWEQLLVFGADPASLISSTNAIKRARAIWPLIGAYRWEFAALTVGVVLLGLAVGTSVAGLATHWVPAVSAVAGVAGISSSAIQARAKNTARGLSTWLRDHLYIELIEEGATKLPVVTK